jgi:adenylosuccinate synthase
VVNSEYFINNEITKGKNVLAEGAQGSMLDVDFGTFPFVTSSSTITAGVCSGLGIAPQKIKEVIAEEKLSTPEAIYIVEVYKRIIHESTNKYGEMEDEDGTTMKVCLTSSDRQTLFFRVLEKKK